MTEPCDPVNWNAPGRLTGRLVGTVTLTPASRSRATQHSSSGAMLYDHSSAQLRRQKGWESVLRRAVAWRLFITLALVATAGYAGSQSNSMRADASTSSGESNVGLSDARFRTAVAAAAAQGRAVHISGTMYAAGLSLAVDLQLNQNGSSIGTVTVDGAALPMRAVGGVYYVQMTQGYINYLAETKGANVEWNSPLAGKWVTSLAGPSSMAAGYAGLLNYTLFFSTVTGHPDGVPVHAAGTTMFAGHTAAVYTTTSGDKIYIAASGPAYLLRSEGARPNMGGVLTFTWDQPVAVAAPSASDIAH